MSAGQLPEEFDGCRTMRGDADSAQHGETSRKGQDSQQTQPFQMFRKVWSEMALKAGEKEHQAYGKKTGSCQD